jgi:hypothetical protein
VIVVTSSGDGGIAGAVRVGVRSKLITCFTESLPISSPTRPTCGRGVSPSGGLLDTGLWSAQRNRPPELEREWEHTPGPVLTFEQFRERLAAAGVNADLADLNELGRFVVAEIKTGRFVIGHNLDDAGHLLHARADAIGAGSLPPHHNL